MAKDKNLKFEIINNIGVLSEGTKGWKKELNRVSWNGAEPKYDLRDWNEDHTLCGKGCTLSEEDIRVLKDILISEVAFLDED
ncbi:YdbC family protein [Hornefia butyriciproducens]|uniref:YdbC family protein n=1 Tax=Hornefia butyriciproducens TaxID=2652293 RepID=UPI003F8B07E6